MNKTAQNKRIISIAATISKAITAEAEDILKDAEAVVKKYMPARYVKAALKKIEKNLADNGIEAQFDKAVTRRELRQTASVNPSARELNEAIDMISKATIAEFEDVLKDADEVADSSIKKFASADHSEVESKMKNVIEKRMRSIGIYCRFARTAQTRAKNKEAIVAAIKKYRATKVAHKKAVVKKLAARRHARSQKNK
jgi:hypothetical protein